MCSTKHSGKSWVIVTVNSGSTSVKLAAFQARGAEAVTELARKSLAAGDLDARQVLREFLSTLPGPPAALAHRVVHGGRRFTSAIRIDTEVSAGIQALSELAPLHNPKAVEWIEAARAVTGPAVAQVAAFDTAFFAPLPRVAGEYALASRYGVDQGVRRYGFHGLAHQGLWKRWSQLRPDLSRGGKLITLQMGGGVSAAAIDEGRPVDTSMGFSPLEGLVMATRSGDVDAAIVPHLASRLGRTADEIVALLNRESGISGLTGGITNLGELASNPGEQAQFALDLYCYRARKCVGAYLAVLGGCDGIVFGGGVGEHVPAVRERILAGMSWAGIELDMEANEAARGQEARIDTDRLTVRVQVVPVQEEQILVEAALEVLSGQTTA